MSGFPALWRNRDYMLLWSGQVVSTLGSTAASMVYPLLILALTESPAAAGLAYAARMVPYILFSLPVGALIDRWDRKRVMIVSDVGRAVVVASIPLALAFDALTVAQLYAVAFVEGTFYVFFNLAEVAALSRVVPAEHLPQAAAQNEAAFGVANIAGPSIGTFLYQVIGRAAPFVADAVSFLGSALAIAAIRQPFRKAAPAQPRRLGVEIAEGLQWLWRTPLVRTMAFLTGGLNMVEAAAPLIMIVLAKQLGASDVDVGLIFSIGAVGGVVGALIGGLVQRRFSFAGVIVFTVWAHAVLFALYAFVPHALVLGLIAACISAIGPVYNVVQFSYRIALIPDELQGRVNSTFRLLAFGLTPLGAALSGFVLERYGTTITIAIFTAWCVVLSLIATRSSHVRAARPLKEIAA
jgi:MFS family permease